MPEETPKTCSTTGFNYCFWAKLLVAIPAIPLIALIAASFFSDQLARMVAGAGAAFAAILVAIWLDRLPFLSRKFRQK